MPVHATLHGMTQLQMWPRCAPSSSSGSSGSGSRRAASRPVLCGRSRLCVAAFNDDRPPSSEGKQQQQQQQRKTDMQRKVNSMLEQLNARLGAGQNRPNGEQQQARPPGSMGSTDPSLWQGSDAVDAQEMLAQLQAGVEEARSRWDALPNKSTVFGVTVAVVGGVYLSAGILSAVDRLPLVPQLMQLVGLGFTTWFYLRYLLFASGRADLARDLARLGEDASLRGRVLGQGLTELAKDTADPKATSGVLEGSEAGGGGMDVSERYSNAARLLREHQSQARHAQGPPSRDDGSWIDAMEASGDAGLGDVYPAPAPVANDIDAAVEAEEAQRRLDELARMEAARAGQTPHGRMGTTTPPASDGNGSSGSMDDKEGGGGGSAPRRPTVFAMFADAAGPDLDVNGTGDEYKGGLGGSDAFAAAAAAAGPEGGKAYLDPCLGWDTEACPSLKEPLGDQERMSQLAQEALEAARERPRPPSHGPIENVVEEAEEQVKQELAVRSEDGEEVFTPGQSLRDMLDSAQAETARGIDAFLEAQAPHVSPKDKPPSAGEHKEKKT